MDRRLFGDTLADDIGRGSYGCSFERGRRLYARGSSGLGASSRFVRGHGQSPMAVSLFTDVEGGLRKLTTMLLSEVGRRTWDVIVIVAGPAGAMAAYELARRSLRVL